MQAQIINKFGSPDVFETSDVPVPQVLPNYVLIQMMVTCVNLVDLKIRQGIPAYANVEREWQGEALETNRHTG